MGILSATQLVPIAQRAGWTGNDLVIAVAVALSEGHMPGDPINTANSGAINRANSNGTVDYGIWQINSVHSSLLAADDWSLPSANASMAYKIWTERKAATGNGWTAWSSYNNGSYLTKMAVAQSAAFNPDDSGLILGSDAPAGGLPVYGNDYTSINTFTSLISNPQTWWRIGYFVGGVVCVVIAARMMLKRSGVEGKVLGAVAKVVM